jgi:hypothetical protein
MPSLAESEFYHKGRVQIGETFGMARFNKLQCSEGRNILFYVQEAYISNIRMPDNLKGKKRGI